MSHLSETSELIEIGYRMAENGQMQHAHKFPKISILRLENSQNPFKGFRYVTNMSNAGDSRPKGIDRGVAIVPNNY